MVTEKGKNYFVSNWSECDCHLNACMYNAMKELSAKFAGISIGVVQREYDSGFITVATVYDDNVEESILREMELLAGQFLDHEYQKRFGRFPSQGLSMKVLRYSELEENGYSDNDIHYLFMYRSVYRKAA